MNSMRFYSVCGPVLLIARGGLCMRIRLRVECVLPSSKSIKSVLVEPLNESREPTISLADHPLKRQMGR